MGSKPLTPQYDPAVISAVSDLLRAEDAYGSAPDMAQGNIPINTAKNKIIYGLLPGISEEGLNMLKNNVRQGIGVPAIKKSGLSKMGSLK